MKHTSALVVIPPRAVWDAVQEVRCVRDKSYLRWMPHVNLLYPFLEDDASGDYASPPSPRVSLSSSLTRKPYVVMLGD